jgi:hypothetical protein
LTQGPSTSTSDPLGADGEIVSLESTISKVAAPSQTVNVIEPVHTVSKKTAGVSFASKPVPAQATSRLPSALKSPMVGSFRGFLDPPVCRAATMWTPLDGALVSTAVAM